VLDRASHKRRSLMFQRLHKYYECKKCHGFSLYPILDKNEVKKLYSNNYIQDVNPEFNVKEFDHEDRFKDLHKLLKAKSATEKLFFLDYGCSTNPENLVIAKSLGFFAYGVEVEEDARTKAHSVSGCPILSTSEIINCNLHFDIIFLGDVLEHLTDPLKVLGHLGSLLNPGGLLVIQGPLEGARTLSNFLISIKARIRWMKPADFPPYHVSLATRKSILQALVTSDFTLQQIIITEPQWPAPKMGSKESFTSASLFVFSLTKIVDILLSRNFSNFGTRFYAVVER